MSEENQHATEKNFGPGNVLRAKREEYEWSIEAVAEALHLSTHSVKSIEADRYDALPGPTYVIGYWRSYARLLGIDIEETIEVNKRNLNVVAAESSGVDVNRLLQQQKSGGARVGLIILVILGGLAYYAWQQQFFGLLDDFSLNDDENTVQIQPPESEGKSVEKKQAQVLRPIITEPDSQPPADDAGTQNSIEPTPGSSSLTVSKSEPAAVQSATETNQGGLVLSTVATAPAAGATAPTVGAPATGGQNLLQAQTASTTGSTAPPSPKLVANEASSDGPTAEKNSSGSAAVLVSPGEPTSAGSDTTSMVLTLSKNSWLDIRDKTMKRLLYKNEVAGQTIEVRGKPPFYIYIGTPDGVSILYQGKNVPFETHKSGLFARFKLGEETLEAL